MTKSIRRDYPRQLEEYTENFRRILHDMHQRKFSGEVVLRLVINDGGIRDSQVSYSHTQALTGKMDAFSSQKFDTGRIKE
jgi:hypothetical protein